MPGASYERTTRERVSQEDREAKLDRKRLQTNHLTPRQRWVPQLVENVKNRNPYCKITQDEAYGQQFFPQKS